MMRDIVPSERPLVRASSALDMVSARRRSLKTAAELCRRTSAGRRTPCLRGVPIMHPQCTLPSARTIPAGRTKEYPQTEVEASN